MTNQLLSSKIVVVEEEPRVRGINAAPTGVLGAIGITERGPLDKAVLCTSFEEFEQKFGGFTQDSDLALAAMGFFENGGSQLWVVRTAHHTDITDPESVTALRASGYLTAGGTLTPAVVASANAEPFAVADGDQIILSVNGGANATVSFSANAAMTVPELTALVEAAIPGVTVESVAGGRFEIRTIDTGPTATIQVAAGTAAVFGLDNDLHTGSDAGGIEVVRVEGKDSGAYAERIEVEVRLATSGEADAFDLAVVEDGVYRETFANLVLDPDAARYIETILNDPKNGSALIRVTDQLADNGIPDVQTIPLVGGNDGLTDLDDTDFIGSEVGKTGLNALDQVQDLSLLMVPGRATAAVHNAMVTYCEVARDGMVFAVLDPPEGQSATDIVDYVQNTASLQELTEFAAIYWPRVQVLNPLKSVFGSADRIVVPPAGIIAGVFARTDGAKPGGVYDPPAGIENGRMFGVLGFETDEVLEETKRDLVYPKRINPLTTGPGLPRFIDGSRTLKASGNFPYVAERRGVIFIERSLKQGLQFARHKNNTEGLRAQVRRTITAFLLIQMNNGAFQSKEPAKAFFVDVSDALNTPTVIFSGRLIARVGLATNKPAEFIILSISADTRALEAELASAGV